jgi:hypothetical protein
VQQLPGLLVELAEVAIVFRAKVLSGTMGAVAKWFPSFYGSVAPSFSSSPRP